MSSNKPITMKRLTIKIFLVFLLLIITLSSIGQSYIGLKTGLLTTPCIRNQFAKYSNDKLNYNNSFSIAFRFEHSHSKRFSSGMHVSYDFFNADYHSYWYNPMGGSGTNDFNYKMGYLSFFFYPQLNFGNRINFFINAGPCIGVLTNSYEKGKKVSKPSIDKPQVESEVEGKAKNSLQDGFVAIKSTIGLQYNLNKSWAISVDAGIRYEPCLVYSDNLTKQLDITYNFGFLFKISEKRFNARQNDLNK